MDLVAVANSLGFQATHVRHLGRLGASDRALAILAVDSDTILVTNNAKDYRRIYKQFELHPGLVVILPSLRRAQQLLLFPVVVERLKTLRDCVNLLIDIDAEGHVRVFDWSRDPAAEL